MFSYEKKARSRRYLEETMKDAENANDIALVANTPAQAKYQLHSLGQTAEGIALYVAANKTEYICFKEKKKPFLLKVAHL